MKEKLTKIINGAIQRCLDARRLPAIEIPPILLELPKNSKHGDFATNIAMVIASHINKPPHEIANLIVSNIVDDEGIIKHVEVAGPGFVNLFVDPREWYQTLGIIHRMGRDYGRCDLGRGRYVQTEFVSANPTGPLHVGHGRGGAVGDCLTNILKTAGYRVKKEYYVNDVGSQMDILGRSVFLRYGQFLGKDIQFPENLYQGDYIRDIAREIRIKHNGKYLHLKEEEAIPIFTSYAIQYILNTIKADLKDFGVTFDCWFGESDLFKNNAVHNTIKRLRDAQYIYEKDGAVWFKSTEFGDEKDRVVIRSTGDTTYFGSDLAYHKSKFDRGFEIVIDIWGADHHGYIPRIQAGIQALGYKKNALKVILIQMVNLLREGKPVTMSTRAGKFLTLRAILDEVGNDAARFIFLTRRADTPLDFDLEVAKRKTMDNPVYYVQYAHARICNVIKIASERDIAVPEFQDINPHILELPQEIQLIKQMAIYPGVIEGSAYYFEPHRITYYLTELASTFHSYYNKHRIISSDLALTRARLYLVAALRMVLENGLGLIRVSAPEKM